MMKNLLMIGLLVFVLPQVSQAQEFAGVLGASQTTFKTTFASESGLGLHGGLQYYYLVGDQVFFRTGAVVTQRKFDTGSFDYSFLYVDIPLSVEYRLDDMFGFFVGLQLAVLISDSCDSQDGSNCPPPTNINNTPLAVPVGVNLMFNDRAGLDIFYMHGVSEVYEDVDWGGSFGAQLVYKF